MYCTNCGNKLDPGDVFCPYCGTRAVQETGDTGFPGIETDDRAVWHEEPPRIDIPSGYENVPPNPGEAETKTVRYIVVATGCIGLSWVLMFLLRIISRIFWTIGYGLPYMGPLSRIVNALSITLGYLQSGIIWFLIIFALGVIGGLIYMLTKRRYGSNQMIILGIIDAVLVLLSAILCKMPLYSFFSTLIIRASAIVSVIIGIDLFLNVFVEKKALNGYFNLSDDIALIKNKISKADTVDSTHYTDINIPKYTKTPEREPGESYFDGDGTELFIKNLLLGLITMFTCGLAAPVMLADIIKWKKEHTVIEGKRQTFNGTAGQLFGLWIKWYLLTLVTCGIYAYFAYVDYYKWVTKHTAYEGTQAINGEFRDSFFDGNTAEAIGNQILCGLITSFTCGIGYPWGYTMLTRWEKKSTVINRERYFYDGDGGGLFSVFIIVFLLNLITCGIYSSWGQCRLERYIISHTHVDVRWYM